MDEARAKRIVDLAALQMMMESGVKDKRGDPFDLMMHEVSAKALVAVKDRLIVEFNELAREDPTFMYEAVGEGIKPRDLAKLPDLFKEVMAEAAGLDTGMVRAAMNEHVGYHQHSDGTWHGKADA